MSSKRYFTSNILEENGKTIHLLKANTKMYKGNRKRSKHDIVKTLKRFKNADGEMEIF